MPGTTSPVVPGTTSSVVPGITSPVGPETPSSLLKQYRGVTIENRRAAKQTATQSALLCGGLSGNFEEEGGGGGQRIAK